MIFQWIKASYTYGRNHSHDPGRPPKSTIWTARNGQVEWIGHNGIAICDQTGTLAQVLEDQSGIHQAKE